MENVVLESEIPSGLHFEHFVPCNEAVGRFAMEHTPVRMTPNELQLDEIVGNSEALLRVVEEIETVASTDSTVLIYGETGTGKELIARAVHNLSPRKSHALVKFNCAAFPTGLLLTILSVFSQLIRGLKVGQDSPKAR